MVACPSATLLLSVCTPDWSDRMCQPKILERHFKVFFCVKTQRSEAQVIVGVFVCCYLSTHASFGTVIKSFATVSLYIYILTKKLNHEHKHDIRMCNLRRRFRKQSRISWRSARSTVQRRKINFIAVWIKIRQYFIRTFKVS